MPSPSDAQISEIQAQREANTAQQLQSFAQWPLVTRALHKRANCSQSPSELLAQLHHTALAHAVRAQRGFDRAGRALLAVVEHAAPSSLDARTLHSLLTTRGVLDSEAADAIESGELLADLSGLEILSCTVPWHIAEAHFLLKAHRPAPGDDIGNLRTATRALNFIGPNCRLMLSLAHCGLIDVMAALSDLRARKPEANITEAMASFMVALRSAARLQHTFRDRDSGAAAGTWEGLCGPLLYTHERRAADDTTRYAPDDLHAIVNMIKPLASMFDAQESILGSSPYTIAPEVVLRVGYDDAPPPELARRRLGRRRRRRRRQQRRRLGWRRRRRRRLLTRWYRRPCPRARRRPSRGRHRRLVLERPRLLRPRPAIPSPVLRLQRPAAG